MKLSGISLAVCMSLLLPVTAASALDCEDPLDTASALQCAADALSSADTNLNALYRTLVQRLKSHETDAAEKLLRTSQRNWISFRDSECALRGHVMEGGSYQSVIETSCRADLTKERNAHLEHLLEIY